MIICYMLTLGARFLVVLLLYSLGMTINLKEHYRKSIKFEKMDDILSSMASNPINIRWIRTGTAILKKVCITDIFPWKSK